MLFLDHPLALLTVALISFPIYVSLAKLFWGERSGSLGETIRLEGLVLVPDLPGRLPKELRLLSQLVSGGVPRTWSVPWVDAWRFGPVDPSAELPKEFGVLLSDLSLHPTAPRT